MPESASAALAVAANLRRLSQERGISLSEIARRAEVHRTHVSLILRGRRMVQIDTVVKLAGAYPRGASLQQTQRNRLVCSTKDDDA